MMIQFEKEPLKKFSFWRFRGYIETVSSQLHDDGRTVNGAMFYVGVYKLQRLNRKALELIVFNRHIILAFN